MNTTDILLMIIVILIAVYLSRMPTMNGMTNGSSLNNNTNSVKETPPAKICPERNGIKRTANPMYDSSESISTIESNSDRLCVNAVYEQTFN